MELLKRLLGKEKSVEEFEYEVSAYLNKKGMPLSIANYSEFRDYYSHTDEGKGIYHTDNGKNIKDVDDKATDYEIGLAYIGDTFSSDGTIKCYIVLYSKGTRLEDKLQSIALGGLKKYFSCVAYSAIDGCETRKRRMHFSIRTEDIPSINVSEFCEQLYNTVSLYSELKKSNIEEIENFAEMEKNFNGRYNKRKMYVEKSMESIEKRKEEIMAQVKELERMLDEEKGTMKAELEGMCVEFYENREKEVMKIIDKSSMKGGVKS